MITADTITDKQIRQLRAVLHTEGEDMYVSHCDVALAPIERGAYEEYHLAIRNDARSYVAKILNARSSKENR